MLLPSSFTIPQTSSRDTTAQFLTGIYRSQKDALLFEYAIQQAIRRHHQYAMNDASTVEIYPRCCFHLSPTFDSWCILRSADVHRLKQHPGFEGMVYDLLFQWLTLTI